MDKTCIRCIYGPVEPIKEEKDWEKNGWCISVIAEALAQGRLNPEKPAAPLIEKLRGIVSNLLQKERDVEYVKGVRFGIKQREGAEEKIRQEVLKEIIESMDYYPGDSGGYYQIVYPKMQDLIKKLKEKE